jgi:hypothetical protein
MKLPWKKKVLGKGILLLVSRSLMLFPAKPDYISAWRLVLRAVKKNFHEFQKLNPNNSLIQFGAKRPPSSLSKQINSG